MRNWPWGLLSGALLAGCEKPVAYQPPPPIDSEAPATLETATFALG